MTKRKPRLIWQRRTAMSRFEFSRWHLQRHHRQRCHRFRYYYWNGEHGPHLHSWSDVNHQLAIIKNQNKELEKKDALIQELLAKVASLETTALENVQLCAKLQEFKDLEAKKQNLELQEFNFEISNLKRAEADSLKEQLEESEKCRMNAEEMVRMWESCYYHDMDKLLKQNDDELQAQRAFDKTFWKRELDHMARRHETEKKELRNKLMENGTVKGVEE